MARTTRVVLLTGDYADRLDQLGRAALAARDDQTPLLGGEEHPYDVLKAEYDTLKAEAEAEAEIVHMVAIGRRQFRDLKAKYPPRTEPKEVAESDAKAGVNIEGIEDDLVFASVVVPDPANEGEYLPRFKSRAAFDEWADGLSEGEWASLAIRAWELANGARLDPKELPGLPTRNVEQN